VRGIDGPDAGKLLPFSPHQFSIQFRMIEEPVAAVAEPKPVAEKVIDTRTKLSGA
jgi:hypothetical protein